MELYLHFPHAFRACTRTTVLYPSSWQTRCIHVRVQITEKFQTGDGDIAFEHAGVSKIGFSVKNSPIFGLSIIPAKISAHKHVLCFGTLTGSHFWQWPGAIQGVLLSDIVKNLLRQLTPQMTSYLCSECQHKPLLSLYSLEEAKNTWKTFQA
jgi:hypothetical protein